MPIYSVQGPDGRIYDVEGPAGASDDQIISFLRSQMARAAPTEPAAKPESGFLPALKAGARGLAGDVAALAGRTGIVSTEAAEKFREEQERKAKETFKPTEEGWGQAPLTKFGELLGGSLPYMAAPVAAGIVAPAGLAGLAATGAVSATQFAGSNLARQMEEGKTLKETSLGSALAAAPFQAALDVVSMRMIPGVRGILGGFGKEVSEREASALAKQALSKVAADYTKATGKAMGAEGLTEASQQVLERMQAGLNLTDPQARQEYLDNFIGGAVLGGALAPVGRYVERGAEQRRAQEERRKELLSQQQAEEAAAEQAKNTQDYALKTAADYAAAQKQQDDLKAQVRTGTKDKPLTEEDKAFNASINKQLRELHPRLEELAFEKNRVTQSGLLAQAEEEKRKAGLTPTEYMLEQTPEVTESKFTPVEPDMAGLEFPEPVLPSAAPNQRRVLQDYAAQNVQRANADLFSDEKDPADAREDYAQYLMQDFAKARALVQTRPNIANLTAKQNTDLYKRLAQLVAKEEERIAAGTASAQQRLGVVEDEEIAAMAERRRQEAEERARATQEALQAKGAVEEARTQMRIAPEIEAVRRLGKVPEESWAAANAEAARERMAQKEKDAELAQKLVETLPVEPRKQPPGRVESGMAAPKARRSELMARLEIAKATRNDEAVQEIRDALDDLDQAEEVAGRGTLNIAPETIKALSGSEAPVVVDKQVEIGQALDAQNDALIRAVRALEDTRRVGQNILPPAFYTRLENARKVLAERLRDPKASKESRAAAQKAYDDLKRAFTLQRRGQTKLAVPAEMQARIDQARRDYVDAQIKELTAQYESYNLGAPADWEKGEARARVMDAFNELESRWDVFGAPMQAVEVLQDQMRQNINTSVANAIKRQTKATEEKLAPVRRGPRIVADELKLRGEEKVEKDDKKAALNLIDRLLATLPTRNRAVAAGIQKAAPKVTDFADMAKLFRADTEQVVTEKTTPEVVEFLERTRDALVDSTNPELASLAREQAQRVLEGRLPEAGAVREIDDIIKMQQAAAASETRPGATPEELQRTSAQTQEVLFPEAEVATTRATPRNFQRMLDSKDIQGLRQAIADQKQANIDVLRTIQERLPGSQRSITRAEARTKKALERAKELGESAATMTDEVKQEWAAAARDVVAAESAVQAIPRRIAYLQDIKTSLEGLNKTGRDTLMAMVNEALNFVNNKKNPSALRDSLEAKEFTELKQWLDPAKIDTEVKRLNTLYKQASKALEPARARLQAALDKYGQDTTIRESLDREHQKAQRAVERAKEAEREAKAASAEEEKQAKEDRAKAIETDRQYRAAVTRAKTGMGLPGRRIEVDTAELRRQEAALRRAMGSLQDQVDTLKTKVDAAKKEKTKEELSTKLQEAQEKFLAKEQELEQLYEKAPRKETTIKETGEEELTKAFTDVEATKRAAAEARKRKREGEGAPALPTRIQGQLMRQGNTQRIVQTGVKRINRAVQIAGELLEKRAVSQAELKEVQDRMQRLRDAGKDKENRRYTPLFKKLQAEEERLQNRIKKIDALHRKAIEAQGGKKFTGLATESTTSTHTPPELTTVEALKDGRLLDALDYLAQVGKEPIVREHADKLRQFVMRTKVKFDPALRVDGKDVPAAYFPEANTIVLNPNTFTEEDLIHEVTHAATVQTLTMPEEQLTADQLAAKRELQNIYDKAKEDPAFAEMYAAKDLLEFTSEVQSDPQTRAMLDKKPWYKQFFAAIMRLLGLGNATSERASKLIEALYRPATKYKLPEGVEALATIGRNTPNAKGLEKALAVADSIIASKPSVREQVEANLGLSFRTQMLDRLAPLEKAATYIRDSLRGTQMMYYLRMMGQVMHFVQQSVARGVPQLVAHKRADGRTEYILESRDTTSLSDVVKTLKQTPGMNAQAANRLFTLYLAALRGDRVGYDKLNFGVPASDIRAAKAEIEADEDVRKVFEQAREQYNTYNRDLIRLLEQAGTITPEESRRLSATNDYIPFYREEKGNAVLVIGGEGTYKIGNLKDQPQLKQLIGGDEKIYDFLTSSVQNTNMLVDMALRNLAVKNAMYELQQLGMVKFLRGKTDGSDIVRFKDHGEDKYVQVNSENVLGIPAELMVKGLEGIPVNNSALVKALALPANFLRRAVTASPLYAARQLFRDSVAAPLLSGADFTPVLGALKQMSNSATKNTLESRGIVGGQVFTGTNEDLSRILGELQAGNIGIGSFIAKAEAIAMEADALTRRAQYDSYLRQGLSEMEATLMSLESMNFNRKGLSPSVRLASQLIPFFNAQVQSLDVLYRAMFGKMPMNERLGIQAKLYQRGALLAATAVGYAMLMQDDEAYKNAHPDEKYGNFFVRVPGIDEAIRIPVPFEIGYIFKALPEAIVNTLMSEHGGEEAAKAFKQIALQTVPGGTSFLLPAAVKPIVENVTNYSFFSGRGIESKAEQMLEPSQRFRDNTSELAKQIGAVTGTSPLKIENLIRGYTGSLGVALAQAFNLALPTAEGPEKATKRLSETPVIGPLFQPNDAGGIVSAVYDRMTELQQVKSTFNDMVRDGRMAEARAYLQANADKMAGAAIAGNLQEQMTAVTKAMNAIRASSMSPDEKREQLDKMQRLRIKLAEVGREVLGKTTPR